MIMAMITQVMLNYKITAAEEFEPRTMNLKDYKDSVTYFSSSVDGINKSFVDVMKGFDLKGPLDNVTEEILEYGKDHLPEYRSQLIVAADFLPVITISINYLKNANHIIDRELLEPQPLQ